jgi:F0F1-type ATP synthase membrane subunit b/b'
MYDLMNKVKTHNLKVDHVRIRNASQEKKRLESKKEKLQQKLEQAQQKRELYLEQVKNVAQLSAKKKVNYYVENVNNAPSAPIESAEH